MEYYIGIDAHSKTCTFVVMAKDGQILKEGKITTTERNLKDLMRSLKEGKRHLVFEETNLAQWMYLVLRDEVEHLIVCHPAYLPKKSGPKTDYRDAIHLAMQLRAGNLTPVHHEDSPTMNLRAAMSHYESLTVTLGLKKNHFKALLRSEAIAGESAFKTSRNPEMWKNVKNPAKRIVAERLYEEMSQMEKQKEKYTRDFRCDHFGVPITKKLRSVPGVGPVRAHMIAAYICSGHRFENKHKLWSYAKLIRHRDESDGYILRLRTPHGRSELKCAFMGTAQRIIISPEKNALKEYYNYLLEEKKLDKKEAFKGLARKVASICLVIMKKGCEYDDKVIRASFKKTN